MKKTLSRSALSLAVALPMLPAIAQESLILEEVVVTARKRVEIQQEVPVSITAVSGEDLVKRGIVEFTDIQMGNPNVRIAPGSSNGAIATTVAIRGNLQNDVAVQLDPAVGTYLDGMILSRTYGVTTNMVDMQSVQTLKGPQGTLFGRNTTGGAILLTTIDPAVGEGFSGYVKGEAGEEGTLGYSGAVDIPLGERAAVRLVGFHREWDDYLKYTDGTELGKSETDTLRGKLVWDLTDKTSVRLSAEHGEIDATLAGVVTEQPNNPKLDGIPNVGGTFPTPFGTVVTTAVAVPQDQSVETDLYVLNITHDTGWGEAKLITGYRKVDAKAELTLPPGLGWTDQNAPDLENFTAELQLNGSFLNDRLDVTSGLYYFDEQTTEDQTTYTYQEIRDVISVFPEVVSRTLMDTDIKSTSIYAQGTYALTGTTNLTLGGRYTSDERDSNGTNSTLGAPGIPLKYDDDNTEANYLITLDHHFSDDLMTYATTSTGYRSGGANLGEDVDRPGNWGSFDPETVTNYELGMKSEWMDGRVRINAALFYQDYQDYQYTAIALVDGLPTRTAFSTDATISGGELDIMALLPAEFTLQLTYGYTDGEIDGGTNDGDALPNIPENTYSVSLSKTFETDIGDFDLSAIYDYRDSTYAQVGAEDFSTTDDRDLLNLSATYTRGPWTVAAYVNNATDEKYYNGITYSPASPAAFGLFGLSFTSMSLPRVAGMRLGYDF
jgi:iron complex outermembrane recepter protein